MKKKTNNSLKIIMVGDLFPTYRNENEFIKGDIEWLYGKKIINLFKEADFSICNLEGALTNEEKSIKKVGPRIKAVPETIKGIKELGIKCVTLANNHIIDYGKKGYEETIKTLKENNIDYFGAGDNINNIKKYYEIDANGKKVIFYNVAETMFDIPSKNYPGVNIFDEYETYKEIQSLKKKCDYLIVIYHGGQEFYWYGSEILRKRFHRLADNGADIVVSQHTHCIGLWENYKDAFLLYGQGDFHFANTFTEYREYGIILEINISDKGLDIKKHLTRRIDGNITYDETQNFEQFQKRSDLLTNNETFDKEFGEFADRKVAMFLEAFRGKNIIDKIIKKIFPKEVYIRYLKSRFADKHLLRIISGVQFEEHNEILTRGLWDMIDKKD